MQGWEFPVLPLATLLSTAVLKVSISASPGTLKEMQILGPYPRSTEPETLGVGPAIWV